MLYVPHMTKMGNQWTSMCQTLEGNIRNHAMIHLRNCSKATRTMIWQLQHPSCNGWVAPSPGGPAPAGLARPWLATPMWLPYERLNEDNFTI